MGLPYKTIHLSDRGAALQALKGIEICCDLQGSLHLLPLELHVSSLVVTL
jgi:hypothetical protein